MVSSTAAMESAYLACGLVMGMMIAETTVMKIRIIARTIRAAQLNSGVTMVDAYSDHGNVTTKMTARTILMKRDALIRHVLMENSHVQTTDVFLWHRFVME